jgi:glucose 1-dehydrogenase
MKLQNKVVFITDADCPTGKVITDRLADEGAHFILNSVSNGKEIQLQLNHCHATCSKVHIVNINLCRYSDVAKMLEEASQLVGSVDILIHNNNTVEPALVETCEEELFLRILNANTKTAFICTQAVGKPMVAKQAGKIIFISSIHAEKPTGSSFAYSASKGAVKMLSRETALNLGRHGVKVNVIEMGPFQGDDETFKSDISSLYDSYRYKVPDTVLGTPKDTANLVLYLCSDEAGYMNGADIRLDGGFLMHYIDFKMKKT